MLATAVPPSVSPDRRKKVRRPMASPGIPTDTLPAPEAWLFLRINFILRISLNAAVDLQQFKASDKRRSKLGEPVIVPDVVRFVIAGAGFVFRFRNLGFLHGHVGNRCAAGYRDRSRASGHGHASQEGASVTPWCLCIFAHVFPPPAS
jgi:hypothetical protein